MLLFHYITIFKNIIKIRPQLLELSCVQTDQ